MVLDIVQGFWSMEWGFWFAAIVTALTLLGVLRIRAHHKSMFHAARNDEQLPIPCHRLQPKWQRDATVADAFRGRLDSRWAAFKRGLAAIMAVVPIYAVIVVREAICFFLPYRFAFVSLSEIQRRHRSRELQLSTCVDHAHFGTMAFGATGRAVAFAGRCRYHAPAAVLGIEQSFWSGRQPGAEESLILQLVSLLKRIVAPFWLRTILVRAWWNSILDHEITHCQQELMYGALTSECHPRSVLEFWLHFLFWEIHAHLLGGPLVFICTCVIGFPISLLIGVSVFRVIAGLFGIPVL